MSESERSYRLTSWHECTECNFQGTFTFSPEDEEDYTDPDALGYAMHAQCPACEYRESLLVGVEHYREMLELAKQRPGKE